MILKPIPNERSVTFYKSESLFFEKIISFQVTCYGMFCHTFTKTPHPPAENFEKMYKTARKIIFSKNSDTFVNH